MGLSSSKTKTTQDQNTTQHGTTMPIAPPWLTDALHSQADRIGAYAQTDPTQYVAPASSLQQQAWQAGANVGGWQPGNMAGNALAMHAGMSGPNTAGIYPHGGGKAPPGTGGQFQLPQGQQPGANGNPALTGASQMGAYQNPWDQQVVDTTLAGFDRNTGQQHAAMAAAAARNGAFGGSRYGIQEGQFAADSGLNRAGIEAQLRQQGFNTAAGYGMQDAASGNQMRQFDANQRDAALNRQLQAAGLLYQGADSYGANNRADIGLQAQLGDQQRGVDQAFRAAPIGQLEELSNLYGNLPYQALVGQDVNSTGTMHGTSVQKSSPSLFNTLMQLGSTAAMFL